MTKHPAAPTHDMLRISALVRRIRCWSGWNRQFAVDCLVVALLCGLWSLTGSSFVDAQYSWVRVPDDWQPLWDQLWAVAVTLPYALHRIRPTIAIRWFLVTVVAQLIVGPGVFMADFMAAVMLYSGLVYGTRAQVRRYLVTAAVFDVLVSAVSAVRQFVVSYDWTRYGAPTMHQLLWGDYQCLNYTEVDGGTVCSESMAYGGIVSTSLTLAVLITIVLVFAIVAGFWQRARHQTITLLHERNAAIRAREQEEQLITASAERARIARDMHDVVAHTLSIIIIQSDGGRYAAVHDPQLARGTMLTIRHESQRALDDMTQLLGVFNDSPTADYHDIDALINQARSVNSAMQLTRTVSGTPQPDELSPAASEALYHVVQEALTNIRKYAGHAVHVEVTEQWSDDALSITIDDDGRGASASLDGHTPGYGLIGMRERIEAVGGTVDSGPRLSGGFEVSAQVPLRDAPTATHAREEIPSRSLTQTQASPHAAEAAMPLDEESRTSSTAPKAHGTSGHAVQVRGPLVHRLANLFRHLKGAPIDSVRQDVHANWIVRLSHWFENHYVLTDTFITFTFIAFFCTMGADITSTMGGDPPILGWLERIMTVLLLAPLALRRRFPQTVAVIFAVICFAQLLFLPSMYMANLSAPLVVYTAAVHGRRGNWKWLVPLCAIDSVAFACKVLAFNRCHYTLFGMLAGGAPAEHCVVSLRLSVEQILVMGSSIAFVCCMIAMVFGMWVRVNGSNPQVLQARADALRAEQEKARIAAANRERDRISAAIQGEVSETLHTVIDQTSQELDEMDAQIASGETPSPESINAAFAAIGAQGRAALARMRQLLSVLRETGFSDDHADVDAHMTMPLAPVDAMARRQDTADS